MHITATTRVSSDSSELGAFLAIYFGTIFAILLLAYVLHAVAYMGVFKKAGIPAWKAWVPVLNNWVFFQLGGVAGPVSLVMFLFSMIQIWPSITILKAFRKEGTGWIVGMVLAPVIMLLILGFGDAQYDADGLESGREHALAAGAKHGNGGQAGTAAAQYGQPAQYGQTTPYGQ